MKIKKFFFGKRVKLISLKKFEDQRGFFYESFSNRSLNHLGIFENFVQDNMSSNKTKGTLRGLHYQQHPKAQSKLINVINGSIQDVIVCVDKNSKYYGKHISVIMKAQSDEILYIPEGFAHGFCTLEDNTLLNYKVSNYYYPLLEKTILYNDVNLNIEWQIKIDKNKISKKDKMGEKFEIIVNV